LASANLSKIVVGCDDRVTYANEGRVMAISPEIYKALDATAIGQLVQTRQLQAEELLETALALSKEINPKLNAITHFMEASALENPSIRNTSGPFAGVPALLKDITTHAKGWPITSGSIPFSDHVSSYDNTLVQRYRTAGMVLFGRTHSPEFGYAASSESKLFGATRNPWNLARSAGGSSGGAAAAVAAGIVPIAQGGDSGGSIRIPSSFCNLFGLKPSRGRVPGGPAFGLPSFLGFSTGHVLTRSVRDSAAALDISQGPEIGSPFFLEAPNERYRDVILRDPPALRIGVQRKAYDGTRVSKECMAAVNAAAQLLEELGHEVVDANLHFEHEKLTGLYDVVWPTIILRSLDAYSETYGKSWRPEDLEANTARSIDLARKSTSADFAKALEDMLGVSSAFQRQSDKFDLILTPTTANEAPEIGVLNPSNPNADEMQAALKEAVAFTQIYNVTGQPAASVPFGWTENGTPVGVQIAGRYSDDRTVLMVASQIERARPWTGRWPLLQDF
jgi:amidase